MSANSGPIGFSMEDFDYTFKDCGELQDMLGVIQQQVATGDFTDQLLPLLPADVYSGPLSLQFQPRHSLHPPLPVCYNDAAAMPPPPPSQFAFNGAAATRQPQPAGSQGLLGASAAASPFTNPRLITAQSPLELNSAHQAAYNGRQYSQAVQSNGPGAVPPRSKGGAAAAGGSAQPAAYSGGYPTGLNGMQQQHFLSPPQQHGSLHLASLVGRGGGSGAEKPQISHSTVEKQRRDRINTLIDELRELVPPSAALPKTDGLESRRPKHLVLADTIALLKNMHSNKAMAGGSLCAAQSLPLPAMVAPSPALPSASAAQGGPQWCEVKVEPAPLLVQGGLGGAALPGICDPPAQGSSSGPQRLADAVDEQEDMDVINGAPQLPHIPMQRCGNAGVSVEKGPKDCMYVQVKCRDRRGLLSDIINALRELPLEIRTASVTTTADGSVRDVFEVMPDGGGVPMEPDEVQNLVHDALFQPHVAKRAR